jgi:hypothetical protein
LPEIAALRNEDADITPVPWSQQRDLRNAAHAVMQWTQPAVVYLSNKINKLRVKADSGRV